MNPSLPALLAAGRIGRLDAAFADFVWRHTAGSEEERGLVALAAAAASAHTNAGHVCMSVGGLAGTPVLPPPEEPADPEATTPEADALADVVWPALEPWMSALRGSECVGDGSASTPLVLDGAGRLYLHRYWEHESRVTLWLHQRVSESAGDVDEAWLRGAIERLFPAEAAEVLPQAEAATDWRKLAALLVLIRRFTIISGGPGTGKTTAVIRLLALLLEQAENEGKRLRIALVAPTGKAAARLQETVDKQRADVPTTPTVRASLPTEATTLHRRLGAYGSGFTYGPDNRIPYDVVVVDEASMVGMVLLSRLIGALEDGAHLVLLGDRDQLVSVDAGAVFGDLCRRAHTAGYSSGLSARFARVTSAPLQGAGAAPPSAEATGVGDAMVQLQRNFRFSATSGIGALAAATVASDAEKVLSVLRTAAPGTLALLTPGKETTAALVCREAVLGYAPFLAATTIAAAYDEFLKFRILCAHRRGDAGVETLNPAIEARLAAARLIPRDSRWYPGRPVMVTQNDAALRLSNGDVGLAWKSAEGVLLVYFPDGKGDFRTFQPTRLPAHETVYAMTVHKSQGSEFGRVVLVLPEEVSPILTRELIYTGVTRALDGVTIIGTAQVLRAGVLARVERESGVG